MRNAQSWNRIDPQTLLSYSKTHWPLFGPFHSLGELRSHRWGPGRPVDWASWFQAMAFANECEALHKAMRIQSHILGEQSQSQYPKSEACGFSATYLKARGQYRPLQAFEPSKRLQIPVPTTYDTLVYRNLSPTSPCTYPYPYPYLLSIYPSIHPSICIMYIYNSLYIYIH